MARPEQLPQGQIVPSARPIEAFVQPGQSNVAQPNAPAQFGNPRGMNFVGTGGTPGVQTSNSYEELARALGPFNQQLTQAVGTAGIAFARGQMAEGERRAKAAALEAIAKNDASMEGAELQRAAQNRAVAAKDPQAGGLMAVLNPYMERGWERGNAKLAGQAAIAGLPAYVAKRANEIDYAAPDQGFGKLAQFQAEYTAQLAQKWGLNATSPGFQKYTLPELEKAQERVQIKHMSDRKEYFDTAAVGQASSLLKSLYDSSNTGIVEYNGETYRRSENKAAFKTARQYKAQQILQQVVLSSSLPGEATERSKKIFQTLSAAADYKNDPEFKSFIESIPSTEPARGADGKVIVDPASGQPFRQTWGEMYRVESIDSEIKYGQAGYAQKKREREESVQGADGFDDGLLKLLGNIPGEGPEQKAAADLYVEEWYARNGKRLGVGYAELQKRRDDLVELDAKRYAELTDPQAAPSFWTDLEADRGKFDAAAWRIRSNQVAAQIFDPKEKASFIKQSNERIGAREIEQATFKAYDGIRDKVINDNIKSRTAQFYSDPTNADGLESVTRQRGAYTVAVNSALLMKEKQLGRKLFDSEVRSTAQEAIQSYGRGAGSTGSSGQSQLDYLFPGSRRTDEPSVKGSGVNNYGKQPKTYNLSDLGSIENREIVLPNYRRNPVLSGNATVDLLRIAVSGAPWPKPFDRAWRDSRAKNAGEFLLFHADHYGIEVPPEMRRQINLKTSASANAGNAVVSQAATAQRNPLVASLGSFALNALTGATPASAGTLDSAPARYGGGGSTGGLTPLTLDRPSPFDIRRAERLQPVAIKTGSYSMPTGGGGPTRGLAATVSAGEGGWDSVNYGTTGSASRMPLTGMTIGQVEKLQSQGKVFAVGAYQFTPGVLARARRDAGLPADAPMTPANQTKLFWGLATGGKRPTLAAYLKGQSNDLNGAHQELAMEWAGVQGPNGRGYYDGDAAGNRASVGAARVRAALIAARRSLSGR